MEITERDGETPYNNAHYSEPSYLLLYFMRLKLKDPTPFIKGHKENIITWNSFDLIADFSKSVR